MPILDNQMRKRFSHLLADLQRQFPGPIATLNCKLCGGMTLHYANCPDASADGEVYACQSIMAEVAAIKADRVLKNNHTGHGDAPRR